MNRLTREILGMTVLPPKLVELARLVQAQDNNWHITSHPQYLVQYKEKVYGVADDYTDLATWIDTNTSEPVVGPYVNLLEHRYRKDRVTEFGNYRRVGYQEVDVTLQPFFSEANARAFMTRNAHRYAGMFLYVESGYRNYEWQLLREFLLSIHP